MVLTSISKSSTPVGTAQTVTPTATTGSYGVSTRSVSWSQKLLRPALAAGISLVYGRYVDNRYFSMLEVERAGILAGSVFLADTAGNMILPFLSTSKVNHYRELESMIIEPIIAGVIYSFGKEIVVGEPRGFGSNSYADIAKGVVCDLSAGVLQSFVGPMVM